ncbi:MAG: flagellar basal-body MS-ring/collar protein FliF [Hyphomicrobiales bacterium]
MSGITELLQKLGPSRIAAMGAVAAMLIGFFAFVIMRVSQPQMAPLYSDLTFEDSSAIISQLESLNIEHVVKNEGGTILVARDAILKTRMRLAEDGLPTGGGVGYELFDKGDSLGTTSFVQNLNHLRALEGELARSIRTIDRVSSARVHLVLPDRELFRRDQEQPSASIALKVRGSLEPAQIRAIQHLVASAVEGLKPGRVSIVDETGRLLASGEEDETGFVADNMLERRVTIERRLRGEVEDIVSRIVGPGRTRVQIAAELDFNRITETSDSFDPDGQVVRSQQTRSEASSSSEANPDGAVSVGTELPGATPNGGNGQAQETSKLDDETINYEISRTTKTQVLEAGSIRRLSVAVLVDGVYSRDANGEFTYTPRPQEQLDQIAALVRSAVGFDQGRGDQVQVVNLPFAEGPAAEPVEASDSFIQFTKEDYFYIAELVVIALLTLIVLFFVVRPLLRGILAPAKSEAASADLAEALAGIEGNAAIAGGEAAAQLAPPPDDRTGRMIDTAQAYGEMQAASIQKVGDLVRANPAEAVTIIRTWLQDAA